MKLDIDKLLEGFGDDEPSGPDFEYEPDFGELQIAAQPKGEQQVGDQVIEAEDADYSEVVKIGTGLLEKTMDLRVAVYLAEAGVNRSGFPALAQVLEYIKRGLEEYWDTIHPQLDADDDNDPMERVNALIGLLGDTTVLRQVRRAPVTESKMLGKYSIRHMSVANGEMATPSDMEETPTTAAISAAFQDTSEEDMQEIRDALESSVASVAAIEACLDDKVGGLSPDFSPLGKLLNTALNAVKGAAGEAIVEDAGSDGEVASGGGGGSAPSGGGVGGINSTNDVTRAIDLILDYYNRNEPSSPIPMLLTRAKRLVAADFLTIIQDMAASGETEVRQIGGLPEEDSY